jgi:hypothetical protein
MARWDALTSEQEALLSEVRQEWLAYGLSTAPADRAAAVAAVAQTYEAMGLEPPQIIMWVDSPLAGALAAMMLASGEDGAQAVDQVSGRVREQVLRQVEEQVRQGRVGDQIDSRAWEKSLRNRVEEQVDEQVGTPVMDQIRRHVGDRVDAQVWSEVMQLVGDQVCEDLGGDAQIQRAFYGQHDAGRVADYAALQSLGVSGLDPFRGLIDAARACGWWWPFANAAVFTERPIVAATDDQGRLHCGTGPAVAYRDGWEIYAWHGALVPSEVINGDLTGEDWLEEPDVRVSRAIVERMGYEWLLAYMKAHQDEFDADTFREVAGDESGTLWMISHPHAEDEDDEMVLLEVLDSAPGLDGASGRRVLRVANHDVSIEVERLQGRSS